MEQAISLLSVSVFILTNLMFALSAISGKPFSSKFMRALRDYLANEPKTK